MKNKPHILLIDDDHFFCMVIEEMLVHKGYLITSVYDGHKGLKLLNNNPDAYNLIILDRVMPQFSGLDVLHKICRTPSIREIPVILLTGHANNKHVETAVMYGVFEVLKKPIDENQLLKAVEKALEEKYHAGVT